MPIQSTRADIPHISDVIQGVNTTSPAHLVTDTAWTRAQDVVIRDNLVQQRKAIKVLNGSFSPSISFFASIPQSQSNQNFFIMGGNSSIWQFHPSDPATSVQLTGVSILGGGRWATCTYNNQLFITNEENDLFYTDGSKLSQYSGDRPRARYLEEFFDHIFTGWDIFKGEITPWRGRWSHVYDPSQWGPSSANEADYFDFIEGFDSSLPFYGITGLKRIQDVLYYYTPTSIWPCRYVGLPKVVFCGPPILGVGNGFPYTLVSTEKLHFFFDIVEEDFFVFDGQNPPVSIGRPIRQFFKDTFLTLAKASWDSYANNIIGFVLPENNEVVWIYLSSGAYIGVCYNYQGKKWTHFSFGVGGWTATGIRGGERAKTIGELTGAIKDLGPESIESLGSSGEILKSRIWAAVDGSIIQEEFDAMPLNELFGGPSAPLPYLETADFFYGSLFDKKETDRITIHADYANATGIEVSLSARDNFRDAVVFTVLGIWTPSLSFKELTFPVQQGRIFRWRFRPIGTTIRGFKYFAYEEHVYGVKAEK